MTVRLPIWAALSLLLLAACSDKAASTAGYSARDNAPAGPSSSPPPIHLDQTTVQTLDGVALEEQAYHTAVDNCKGSGFLHALTPSEVAKIGRRHLEAWIGPDKQARHEETWGMNVSSTCNFFLTHWDQTWIADANGRVTTIDNVTHQVDVEQGDKPPWTGGPLSESDAEMDAAHGQALWSKIGVTNSNGTQCVIWQGPGGEQDCAWSGGRQWGYSADGAGALHDGVSVGASIAGSSIILWAHPGKGPSWRLETQAFSVGQPLDPRAFVVPANANPGTPR